MKYENIKEITPKGMVCGIGACSSISKAKRGRQKVYLIIGKTINPADAGLVKKVGDGEGLIEVPRGLIDEMKK